MSGSDDTRFMAMAFAAASGVRHRTSPNPWVGAVVVDIDGNISVGATQPPGGRHAEREALASAGLPSVGATLYTTLEPCNHNGRTSPCTDAVIDAGVTRVVVGIEDPDSKVAGTGIARLREAGITVDVGVMADDIEMQLAPYLHHRRTGRPWVLLKLASSADGRTAAPDGTSQWITGPEARTDAHRLRAESDAILVGSGTAKADNPSLTVRDWPSDASIPPDEVTDPHRIVLGHAPADANMRPCLEWTDSIPMLLDRLGADSVVQLMVEGGAGVARSFHQAGLVNQYIIYTAPVLFGGDDAAGFFGGPGAASVDAVWRGQIVSVERLGSDLRVDMRPVTAGGGVGR